MVTTKVQKTTRTVKDHDGSERQQAQYETTIPVHLAEALNLEGETIEWNIKSQNTLELTRVTDD